MCSLWIWEQTAIISLYNINWLVFKTETECVYCAVRAVFVTIIHSSPAVEQMNAWNLDGLYRRLIAVVQIVAGFSGWTRRNPVMTVITRYDAPRPLNDAVRAHRNTCLYYYWSGWPRCTVRQNRVAKHKHSMSIGHYMYRQFNIQQFYVLPAQCTYVFCVDLRTNSDYFAKHH